MKRRATSWFSLLVALTLLASACSSTDGATTETTTPTSQATTTTDATTTTIEAPATTVAVEPATEIEEVGFEIAPGRTTLLRYLGDARASRDDGETWFYADSGLWLETGDRVQVADGGIAFILFPEGTIIRLEGYADFELVLNEYDSERGSKRIIGRVWDGSALVSTVPLPTEDSLFQLWSMTTFIDLPFDADHAVPLLEADSVADENRLMFAALMNEGIGGEALINYPDSVLPTFYVLEMIDGEIVLIATTPAEDEITEFELPFRDGLQDEFTLEGVLDTVAALVDLTRSGQASLEVGYYGYSLMEEAPISDTQVLYSVFETVDVAEFLAEADDLAGRQEFARYVGGHRYLRRHSYTFHYYETIPDIFAPAILMLISEHNLGCDITSGLGCTPPDGCDRDTGEGCTFVSGCNMITRSGCARARLKCVTHIPCVGSDCHWWQLIAQISHSCRPAIRTFCDPNLPGDCDRFVASTPTSGQSGEGQENEPAVSATVVTSGLMEGLSDETSIPIEIAQDESRAGEALMEVNVPVSCEPFVAPVYWEAQARAASGGFDGGDDDAIEWCTCTASSAGWPPPPPNMNMTYRCFCDESIRYDD